MDTNQTWSKAHPIGSKVQLCLASQELEVLTEAFYVPGQHCVLLKTGDHKMVVPLQAIKGTRELFLPNVVLSGGDRERQPDANKS